MNKILFVLMVIIFSGCATSGNNDYLNMEVKYSANPMDLSFEQALSIETEKLEKVSLLEEDSLFKFSGYVSYYKVLKLKTDNGKKYKIDVWSVCDCFAPKKIIDPAFEIYNVKGDLAQSRLIESKTEDVNWQIKRPFSIHNTYEFESAQEQYVYFVLAANNENVGKPITTIRANAYASGIVIPISSSVIAHPLGSFELIVTEKND